MRFTKIDLLKNDLWFNDIEVFKNVFLSIFYNGKEKHIFAIYEGCNDIDKLVEFIEGKNLVTYNGHFYDDVVHNYIIKEHTKWNKLKIKDINMKIYNFSKKLIDSQDEDSKSSFDFRPYKNQDCFYSIDIMKSLGLRKSLKLVAVSLKWPRIQDLPYEYDAIININDSKILNELIDYNFNDVLITEALFKHAIKDIELRYDLSVQYDMDLISDSDSGMANKMFTDIYARETHQSISDFEKKRTFRREIRLSDVIFPIIEFKTRELNNLLSKLKKQILTVNQKYEFPIVTIAGKGYQLGVGGLHSIDLPGIFKKTKTVKIKDKDVKSFYPFIMINNNVRPEHVHPKFTEIIRIITIQRVNEKEKGNKVAEKGLKIVINSVFGKLGFEGFWLYDEQAMIQVTLNGQLFLLMLIEELTRNGFEVISANTDGVTTLVPINKEELFESICSDWQKLTKFELETAEYEKYIRRDVNNYIVELSEGFYKTSKDKIKSKGAFLQDIDIKKGYDMPIIAFGLKAYFIDGQDPTEFIRNHKDIYDYCGSQKVGKQFTNRYNSKNIQNSVRYYVSVNGHELVKVKQEKGEEQYISYCAGYMVTLFNDYFESKDYNIYYPYYEKELIKIIQEIEYSELKQESESDSLF